MHLLHSSAYTGLHLEIFLFGVEGGVALLHIVPSPLQTNYVR